MRGRLPKAPGTRQRRNKETKTTLAEYVGRQRAPSLPKHRDWHRMTRAWWRDVWHSPMAEQYLDADLHGLYRLAELVDRFWLGPDAKLAAEIRQQQTHFGLTPLDRLRLRWEVQKVEAVTRKQTPPERAPAPEHDPRRLLQVVS